MVRQSHCCNGECQASADVKVLFLCLVAEVLHADAVVKVLGAVETGVVDNKLKEKKNMADYLTGT